MFNGCDGDESRPNDIMDWAPEAGLELSNCDGIRTYMSQCENKHTNIDIERELIVQKLSQERERLQQCLDNIDKRIAGHQIKTQLNEAATIRREFICCMITSPVLRQSIRYVEFQRSCIAVHTRSPWWDTDAFNIVIWTDLECFVKFETTCMDTIFAVEYRDGRCVPSAAHGELLQTLRPSVEKLFLQLNSRYEFKKWALSLQLFN